jgi:NTE family protein
MGLVLAGGGARAAYEVGVVHYVTHEISRELGRDAPLDVLCGTSAGAINVCSLAAFAHEPMRRTDWLANRWRSLQLEEVLCLDTRELVNLATRIVGCRSTAGSVREGHGGIISAAGLRRILGDAIPFERIGPHLWAGRISAVSVSTTHIGSGKTIVFLQQRGRNLQDWGRDTTVEPHVVRLRLEHALASAAIPLLFPAVAIDGHLYCDGALRQNVPLSPARRLGADALLVVSPHSDITQPVESRLEAAREGAFSGPAFLMGKTLNALLLDRLDGDVDRLNRINRILDAGCREYGPTFIDALNRQLGRGELESLRPLNTLVVRPSEDIGLLAGRFLGSPKFRKSSTLTRLIFHRLADSLPEADLASYLLFDGQFASELIELGRADARARHGELVALLAPMLEPQGAPATAA